MKIANNNLLILFISKKSMTTIIGVKTTSGLNSIVIGADKQENFYEDGDILSGKVSTTKIIIGECWMLGHAGFSSDNGFYRFTRMMSGDRRAKSSKEIASKIVKTAVANYISDKSDFDGPHFKETNHLNTKARREGVSFEDLHEFILAARYDEKMGIWRVDEFGNLADCKDKRPFEYECLGSGSGIVENYFNELYKDGGIIVQEIDIPKAIDLVVTGLDKAQSDISTGSFFDLAILTETDLISYGSSILESIQKAKQREIERIKEHYRILEQKSLEKSSEPKKEDALS